MHVAGLHLAVHEVGKVAGVKAIAHLQAVAPVTDVLESAFSQPRVQPIGKDALVWPAELAGPCENTTAVDPYGQAKGVGVFSGKSLGAELGSTVEGYGRRCAE